MRSLSRISMVIQLILLSVQNNKGTVLSHYLPSDDVKTSYEETTAVLSREIMVAQFEDWMGVFKKQYGSAEEKIQRMEIWLQNHLLIEEHNRKEEQSYTLGHNEFSDLSHEEFKEMYRLGDFSRGVLYPSVNLPTGGASEESVTLRGSRRAKAISDMPSEVNWVEKGAVSAVKNQGHCGSCWAFSAAGSIEALVYLRTQKLTNISVQEFLDCDPLDHGCFGGYMNNAFRFDEGIKGMCSDEDYPYKGHKNWFSGCHEKKCEDVPGSDVEAFVNVTGTDAGMIDALQDQPISVAIQANQRAFQFYKKGVFDADCGSELDHGVLTVGYGSEEGKDYFLVKNSWGGKWGDEGYIKLARGDKYPDGQCGIHLMPSRPVL